MDEQNITSPEVQEEIDNQAQGEVTADFLAGAEEAASETPVEISSTTAFIPSFPVDAENDAEEAALTDQSDQSDSSLVETPTEFNNETNA